MARKEREGIRTIPWKEKGAQLCGWKVDMSDSFWNHTGFTTLWGEERGGHFLTVTLKPLQFQNESNESTFPPHNWALFSIKGIVLMHFLPFLACMSILNWSWRLFFGLMALPVSILFTWGDSNLQLSLLLFHHLENYFTSGHFMDKTRKKMSKVRIILASRQNDSWLAYSRFSHA